MQCGSFFIELESLIQQKHLLNHEFYRAWSQGRLSREVLQEYAKEYYQHVKAFPTYLSALHSRTEDATWRRTLLQNLIEEEAGSPNHPELWKEFAMHLGVSEEELASHQPGSEISSLISTFRQICSRQSLPCGVAALFAYESQIPAICLSKIEGLKRYFGFSDPRGWHYFHVHIEADKEHAAQERNLLETSVTEMNQKEVLAAANQVLDKLWDFLSGLCQRHAITC